MCVFSYYNQSMRVQSLHPWQMSPSEARAIQRDLAGQVCRGNEIGAPAMVAGADISASRSGSTGIGAVVVLSFPALELVEVEVVEKRVEWPYIPGLLSFREAPLVVAACERLKSVPGLLLVDGHGIAHPRRCGIASHLGLLLDIPTIGCAKSLLCGTHGLLGEEPGSRADVVEGGEVVGAAVRTRANVRPVYVSIGHKVDLSSAVKWVMKCCTGFRLPQPARLAHMAASGHFPEYAEMGFKNQEENTVARRYGAGTARRAPTENA